MFATEQCLLVLTHHPAVWHQAAQYLDQSSKLLTEKGVRTFNNVFLLAIPKYLLICFQYCYQITINQWLIYYLCLSVQNDFQYIVRNIIIIISIVITIFFLFYLKKKRTEVDLGYCCILLISIFVYKHIEKNAAMSHPYSSKCFTLVCI